MSAELLDAGRAALVVIDVQEGFRKAVAGFEALARRAEVLVRGAQALELPVIVTEQYPRGLGATAAELEPALEAVERLEKTVFSAARAEGFDLGGRDQVLLCGIEAHVCVAQTALDLLAADVQVHVAGDAVGSRSDTDLATGLRRMERAGATISSVEMALFELLGAAGGPRFKAIQELIR